jgi:hypothetical protein
MQLRYIIIPIFLIAILNALVRYIIQIIKEKDYSLTSLSFINFLFIFVPTVVGVAFCMLLPLIKFLYKYW